MTKKQEEIISVLSSPINVRNEDKIKWRTNFMQDNVAVLDTILRLIKERKEYQKSNAILVRLASEQNSILAAPYSLNLMLRYEINKGTKEKSGLELLRLLKLQACRKVSNTLLATQTTSIDMV